MKTFLWGFVLLILITLLRIAPYKSLYLKSFDYNSLDQLYQNSQYQNGDLIIDDSDLYAYAGYTYLTEGKMDEINVEHPPLAKYLYGISAILFDNPTIVQLIFGLLLIILLYILSSQILKNRYWAFLPPLILLADKLFIQQITHNELDLLAVTIIVLFFVLNLLSWHNLKLKMIILGLVLGILASLKFPTTAVILAIVWAIDLLVARQKSPFKKILPVYLTAGVIYILNYLPLLISKGPLSIVLISIKALKVHLSHLPHYPPLAPLKVMFCNSWPIWFDVKIPFRQVEQWSVLWPLAAIGIFILPFLFFRNKEKNISLIILFTLVYFIFINSRLFFPRYLMELLPFAYLFLGWELKVLFTKKIITRL